jgi:lipopolysaccharide transport system ATP-binding protein
LSESVIEIKNLGKTFRIYDKPSDRLKEVFYVFSRQSYHRKFQALNDISFSVKKGEFFGIVGRNGAGKSTLLKVLSHELSPSTGSIQVQGRLSLLQLGVGFDRELSGRDNALFSFKLLGIAESEAQETLARVIEFADIGEFIDHPVKTYSSGMFSRLSFAVGICVRPDILIVDEVLSVGDVRFSQKCLRYMKEFKESGKTAILVTHDVNAVRVFCDRAVWLKDGQLLEIGDARTVAENYTNYMLYDRLPAKLVARNEEIVPNDSTREKGLAEQSSLKLDEIWHENSAWVSAIQDASEIGEGGATILGAMLVDVSRKIKLSTVSGPETVRLLVKVRADRRIGNLYVGWLLNNDYGQAALHLSTEQAGFEVGPLEKNETVVIEFDFTLPALKNGTYVFAMSAQDHSADYAMLHRVFDFMPISLTRSDLVSKQCGYFLLENTGGRVVSRTAERGPTSH